MSDITLTNSKKLLLITKNVPEMKMEILKISSAKFLNNISVLNFETLLEFICKKEFKMPMSNLKKLSETDRIAFMDLSFNKSKRDLCIYKNGLNIIDLIIEFQKKIKENFISIDNFENLVSENQFLVKKTKDFCLILKTFEKLISKDYFDPLDNKKKLYDLLPKVSFLKSYEIAIDGSCFFSGKETRILKILKEKSKKFYIIDNKKNKSIKPKIIKAKDIYEECELVCSVIKKKSYKLNDTAIIVRNEENYKEILTSVFKKSKILYSFRVQDTLINRSISKFILCFFEIFLSNFSLKSVLNYIKTEILDLEQNQITNIENYAYTWTIEGEKWLLKFGKIARNFNSVKDNRLIKINETREKIINPLIKFYEKLKISTTPKEISCVLWEFLKEVKVFEKGNVKDINRIVKILDSISLSFKKEKITIKNYYRILKLSFEKTKIKNENKRYNCVKILTTNEICTCNFKNVFILGVIESEFPKAPSKNKLFSFKEYEELKANNIDLKDSFEDSFVYEEFLFFWALSLGKNNVYVSFYEKNFEGKERFLSEKISKESEFLNIKKEDNIFKKIKKNNLHSEKLFSFPLSLSATQIEQYNLCGFKYFYKYALKIKEQKPIGFDEIEYGNCAHYLMEKLFSKYKADELLSKNISLIVEEILRGYVFLNFGPDFISSYRFNFLFLRMKKFMSVVVSWIVNELSNSDFNPSGCEILVSKDCNENSFKALKISENEKILATVEGKIDRLDTMKKAGKKYFRIIDYKVSKKEFNLSNIVFGIGMQMLVYASIVKKKFKDSLLSGVFYLEMCAPIASSKSECFKNMRMNGMVLSDALSVLGMEKKADGKIINAKIKNNKIVGPCVLNSEDIDKIIDFTKQKILKTAKSIKSSEFLKNPIAKNKDLICKFCEFRNICCYEDYENNRELIKMDNSEVLKKIQHNNNVT